MSPQRSHSRALIVVPTLGNRLQFLDETITSLGAQVPRPTICIVAPSNQRDALLERYCEQPVAFIDDPGRGLSAAINAGWSSVGHHEFLGWLGDDDVLTPDSISLTCSALDRTGADMVHGGLLWINSKGAEIRRTVPLGIESGLLLKYGLNLVWQPGSLFRSNTILQIGGLSEQLKYAMDLDLFIRIAKFGRITHLRRVLAKYRLHHGSISVTSEKEQQREAQSIREMHSRAAKSRAVRAVFHAASRATFAATTTHPPEHARLLTWGD